MEAPAVVEAPAVGRRRQRFRRRRQSWRHRQRSWRRRRGSGGAGGRRDSSGADLAALTAAAVQAAVAAALAGSQAAQARPEPGGGGAAAVYLHSDGRWSRRGCCGAPDGGGGVTVALSSTGSERQTERGRVAAELASCVAVDRPVALRVAEQRLASAARGGFAVGAGGGVACVNAV